VAADLDGLVAGCYSVDGDRPVGELGNRWIRPSKIGTGPGRVLWQDAMATQADRVPQAHGFFRPRTPDQLLVTAARGAHRSCPRVTDKTIGKLLSPSPVIVTRRTYVR
jgi:hypothetical protein